MARRSTDQRIEDRTICRAACELVVSGRVHKGIAVDISPNALFVRLGGGPLPAPGSEVTVNLEEPIRAGSLQLTGEVVRQQTGGAAPTEGERGVAVRIDEAPIEYHELFFDETPCGTPPSESRADADSSEAALDPSAHCRSERRLAARPSSRHGRAPEPRGTARHGLYATFRTQ